jgi:hypothetical protein
LLPMLFSFPFVFPILISICPSVFVPPYLSLIVFVVLQCCQYLVSWGEVRLSPPGTSATVWAIVPAPDDR